MSTTTRNCRGRASAQLNWWLQPVTSRKATFSVLTRIRKRKGFNRKSFQQSSTRRVRRRWWGFSSKRARIKMKLLSPSSIKDYSPFQNYPAASSWGALSKEPTLSSTSSVRSTIFTWPTDSNTSSRSRSTPCATDSSSSFQWTRSSSPIRTYSLSCTPTRITTFTGCWTCPRG